jgi:hypothetical protein
MEPLLPHNKKIQIPNLINGLVPIFPLEKSFPFSVKGLGNTFSITRVQFPLTPAFCLTANKAQGKTFDKVIVDLQKPISGKMDHNYIYVALSRAKSLDNIRILRPFDSSVCREPLKQDLLVETQRLTKLEQDQSLLYSL